MKAKILIPLAGLALFCACKSKGPIQFDDSTSVVFRKEKSRAPVNEVIPSAPKFVKTADIRFKVKNVQQTSERITTLATSLNGKVIHQVISSTTGNSVDIAQANDSLVRVTILNTTAEMAVRIPPENMESFLVKVAQFGIYVNNSRMDVTDKSLDYLSTKLKLQNRRELIAQQLHDSGPKTADELLTFKDNIIDQQMGNRRIEDSVRNSTVTLNFFASNIVSKETIANDNLSAYNPPIFKRLGMSIENGWAVFMDVVIVLTNLWIFVPVGFAVWLLIKYYRKKKPVELS